MARPATTRPPTPTKVLPKFKVSRSTHRLLVVVLIRVAPFKTRSITHPARCSHGCQRLRFSKRRQMFAARWFERMSTVTFLKQRQASTATTKRNKRPRSPHFYRRTAEVDTAAAAAAAVEVRSSTPLREGPRRCAMPAVCSTPPWLW